MIKAKWPTLVVVTDVALDPYNSDGMHIVFAEVRLTAFPLTWGLGRYLFYYLVFQTTGHDGLCSPDDGRILNDESVQVLVKQVDHSNSSSNKNYNNFNKFSSIFG